MKKIYLLIFSTFFACSLYGQCKFDKNEMDEFTNFKNIVTKSTSLAKGYFHNSDIAFRYYGDKYYVMIDAVQSNMDCYSELTSYYFKFEDDEVIMLKNLKSANCQYIKYFLAELSKEQLEKFRNYNLVKIRVSHHEGYQDVDVKEKNRTSIRRDVMCLQSQVK